MQEHSSTRIAIGTAIGVTALLVLWWGMGYYWATAREEKTQQSTNTIQTMILTSTAFDHEGEIPAQYTCDGEGLNPPLTIGDIPEGAKSLVLLMDDPDVPKTIREDGMWDHWTVWNIDPTTTHVTEGVEPDGTHGLTTSSTLEYVPPCPPDKEHRYFFSVYALDARLPLSEGARKKEVQDAMRGHILGQAELMGRYTRTVIE